MIEKHLIIIIASTVISPLWSVYTFILFWLSVKGRRDGLGTGTLNVTPSYEVLYNYAIVALISRRMWVALCVSLCWLARRLCFSIVCGCPLINGLLPLFWYSILKSMIGKDVTKIALPVHLNEPLSFTQVRHILYSWKFSPDTKVSPSPAIFALHSSQ